MELSNNHRLYPANIDLEVTIGSNAIDELQRKLDQADQEHAPADWAVAQGELADALITYGLQDNDPKPLKKAINLYTDTLNYWKRTDAPAEWSATMNSIGIALHAHGKLLKGDRTFEKSVVSYKNALAERSIDDEPPLDYAKTQNNLGAVLQNLGEREENSDRLKEAIESYERALDVWTLMLIPMNQAALIMANLTDTRLILAEVTQDLEQAEKALDELMLIVEVFSGVCDESYREKGERQQAKAEALVEVLSKL